MIGSPQHYDTKLPAPAIAHNPYLLSAWPFRQIASDPPIQTQTAGDVTVSQK
jgi:hypothetical protein